AALDYVSSLPPDSEGIRGAVLLEKGTYEISGSLLINTSGVILRGSGMGKDGTILYGAGKDRETLIRIAGKNDRKTEPAVKITDTYVPVNAMQLQVAAPDQFKAGDKILIHRPSVKKWIDTLQTAHFGGGITYLGWKPGERDIYWDRTITAVKGS